VPNVKTLIMKSVPEATTRAVMVKTGESDISIVLDGPEAEDIKKNPRLQVVSSKHAVDLLDRVPRAMGRQVAVARQAACARRSTWRSTASASTRPPASASARRPA
jgi:hypothetical protein